MPVPYSLVPNPCVSVQFVSMKPKASAAKTPASQALSTPKLGPITMAIDIGGSGLKAMLLSAVGQPVSERQRLPTPAIPTAHMVLRGLEKLRELLPAFDRVSVGFPGVVKRGITWSAFNLHSSWAGFPLQAELE